MENDNKNNNNNDETANNKKRKRKIKVSIGSILSALLAFVVGGLLGFFIGTKNGLNVGEKIALEYMEYNAVQPVKADSSLITSDPAAVYGPEDAEINIKYFSDLECPSCATMMEESLKPITGNERVRVAFYDSPSSSHKYARLAAAYIRCATKQDVDYIDFVSSLNSDYSNWTSMLKEANVSEYLLNTAVKLGADEDTMNLCVIGADVYDAIDANIADGLLVGMRGTPSYLINDNLMSGYVSKETFSRMINQLGSNQ
ncbi:MAG: DsbA family protein [Anaerolineaceae bacterium]|nr:DsbA family protein [Anaerolineaceae bacterium]